MRTSERRVQFLSDDTVLQARVHHYFRRRPDLIFLFSPVPDLSCEVALVPAEMLEKLFLRYPEYLSGRVFLCYGSSRRLKPSFLSGCRDYLRDPWSLEELEARLVRQFPEPDLAAGAVTFSDNSLTSDRKRIPLTFAEAGLLETLVRNIGIPVPREALVPAGSGLNPGSRTLDVTVSRLRHKLRQAGEHTGYVLRIEAVRGIGYRLLESPDYSAVSR